MAVAYRDSAAFTTGSSSVATLNVTIPATSQSGDVAFLAWTTANSDAPVSPSGWTQVGSAVVDGSAQFVLFYKLLSAGDAGATITLNTGSAGSRHSAVVSVYSGVDGTSPVNRSASGTEPGTSTTHTVPTTAATTVASCAALYFIGERGTNPTTSFTGPAGSNIRQTAGGPATAGATSTGVADDMTALSSGATAGGGSWTGVSQANVAMWTVAVAPSANQAPTATAPADQTVASGTLVTLAGTDSDPDGSITGRLWTKLSGPAATLSGSTTATATFTPSAGGTYTFEYEVTDNLGTSDADTCIVYVTDTSSRPEGVRSNPGGWTVVGAASAEAALADASDSSYIEGATGAIGMDHEPVAGGGVTVKYRVAQDPSTPAKSVLVELMMGASTVIASENVPTLTTTPTDGDFVLTSGELAALTDRVQEVWVRFTAT